MRLCHLVSPALPIGAYAYSQGLEFAVQAGWVHDEASALDWLQGLSSHGVGTLDLPILARLHRAWCANDTMMLAYWNAQLLAARETLEARAQERHLGRSLARVLMQLQIPTTLDWLERSGAFATLFSLAAVRWEIPETETLSGYLWGWSENQVLCAVKLVPLGQSAGQRLLYRLTDTMPALIARARSLEDEQIGVGVVSQTLASARHETQYSRLFRS
ncbi:MAG: urease accessory UreF family protein [Steroidobacteraceae bacterium]